MDRLRVEVSGMWSSPIRLRLGDLLRPFRGIVYSRLFNLFTDPANSNSFISHIGIDSARYLIING